MLRGLVGLIVCVALAGCPDLPPVFDQDAQVEVDAASKLDAARTLDGGRCGQLWFDCCRGIGEATYCDPGITCRVVTNHLGQPVGARCEPPLPNP